MRWRWSDALPAIERSTEVELPVDLVYAEFRREDGGTGAGISLVTDEPPSRLEWALTLRGLRDARLRVQLDPVADSVTRVTTRLDARIVGRLRLRRTSLVHDYTLVLTAILDRACARMSEPLGSGAAAGEETASGAGSDEAGLLAGRLGSSAVATRSEWLTECARALWAQPSFRFIPDVVLPSPPEGGRAARRGGPRIAFCGFPSDYSLAFLFGLLDLDVDVVTIITSPGAHEAIVGVNALSQIADHLAIPLLRLWRVNDEHSLLDLSRLELDAVVMASFDQIVGARALAIPGRGWLNIHPSALPAYRGPEPVYWAIADGAPGTGITLHRAVPKFDAGPVLAQRHVDVAPDDTSGTLTRRLCAAGVEALGEAVGRLLAGDPGEALDLDAATYRPSVGHRRLDGAETAAVAERMVRAGEPNMPAWTEVDGEAVYVHAAAVAPDCDGAGLRFSDGCLRLVSYDAICGCHHDAADCPHRQG